MVIQDPTFMLRITYTVPLLELCSRNMTKMKITHTEGSHLELGVTSAIFLMMRVNHHQPRR
jgi:hypothetical protein